MIKPKKRSQQENEDENDGFICSNLTTKPFKLKSAQFVICNHEGVKAAYTEKL